MGLVIVLEDSLPENANGYYRTGTNEIHIAADAMEGGLLATGMHELVHVIKDWNPEGYEDFEAFVLDVIKTQAGEGYDLEARVNALMRRQPDLTREMAMEELVADAIPAVLSDPATVRRLVDMDRTLAEKIRDFLTEFVAELKAVIDRIAGRGHPEMQALMRDAELLEATGAYLTIQMREASQRHAEAEQHGREVLPEQTADVLYSMKPVALSQAQQAENIRAAAQMEDVATLRGDEFEKGEKSLVDQVTDFFDGIGGGVDNALIGEVKLTKGSAKSSVAHGVGRKKAIAFAAVPDIIKNGKIVDYQPGRKGRVADSITIAAPFNIEAGPHAGSYYGVAAINRRESGQSFYLHEVAAVARDTDTGAIQESKASVSFKTLTDSTNGTQSDTLGLTLESILQQMRDVQRENTFQDKKSDATPDNEGDTAPDDRRYSLKEPPQERALAFAGSDAADGAAQALEAAFERVRGQGDVTLGMRAAQRVARKLLRGVKSGYGAEQLAARMETLLSGMRAAEHVDYVEAWQEMRAIALDVLAESGRLDSTLYDQYADMRAYLRTTPISLTQAQREEVASTHDSAENWRRDHMGRLRIAKGGTPLDVAWGELSGQWPEMFPADMAEGDMPAALSAALDAVARTYLADGFDMTGTEAADDTALNLFAGWMEATEAGRVDARLKALDAKAREGIGAYEKRLKEAYDARFRDHRRARLDEQKTLMKRLTAADPQERRILRARIRVLTQWNEQDLAAQRGAFRQWQAMDRLKRAESETVRGHRKRIIQNAQATLKMMEKSTKEKHVPDFMRGPLLDFYKFLDLTIKREGKVSRDWKARLERLTQELHNYQLANSTDDALAATVKDRQRYMGFYLALHEEFLPRLAAFTDGLREGDTLRLGDMDVQMLEELDYLTSVLRGSINAVNKMHRNTQYEAVDELGEAFLAETAGRKTKKTPGMEFVREVKNFLTVDLLSGFDFFGRFGEAGKSIGDELAKGQERMMQRVHEAEDAIAGIMKKNKVKDRDLYKWERQTQEVLLGDGRKIQVPQTFIMNVYAGMKDPDHRRHILEGAGQLQARHGAAVWRLSLQGVSVSRQHAQPRLDARGIPCWMDTPAWDDARDGIALPAAYCGA